MCGIFSVGKFRWGKKVEREYSWCAMNINMMNINTNVYVYIHTFIVNLGFISIII